MDDGAIGTNGADSLERRALMEFTLGAELIEDTGARVFINIVFFLVQLLLKEGKVLHDCGTITNIGVAHTLHLSGILGHLRHLDSVLRRHSHIFAKAMKLGITCISSHTNLDACGVILSQDRYNVIVGA